MNQVSSSLVDLVVRVSLLFGAAALLAALLRRSSAASRHLVWTLAIAASLALPAVMFLAPRWELPVLPASEIASDSASDSSERPAHASSASAKRTTPNIPGALNVANDPTSRSPERLWPAALSPSAYGVRPVFAVWALGFLAILARLGIGSARMWWIARRARPLPDGTWLRLARRLAGALGVRDRVVFLEGSRSAMPMTWGVWRPRVLLPEAANEWPTARQRVVLLHELAHVKRRDCVTQLLAQAACAVYWFHPLSWFAAARLRAERERACDDLVLAAGTRGSDYADHLLDIARSMRTVALPTWAAVAMAHRSQLEGRLMAILDPEVPRRFPTRRRSLMLAAVIAIVALPIAVITPVPQAAEAVTIIESGPLASDAQPTPGPAPTPAPSPSPSRQASASVAVPRATTKPAAGATWQLSAAEWLGTVVGGAIKGAAGGAGQGIADGIVEGLAEGTKEGVREALQEGRAARRDPRAVAALMEALKDSDGEVRENAMQALVKMRAPEALDAIRAALKDANPSVREQAAFALGQYRDRTSVGALAAALKDESGDVREQAVFALGQIRDASAGEALMSALKDADADVREQAAFALGKLRLRDAVGALGAAVKDASASVREQAVFALGQIRDSRALDALIGALRDESASVREQAAFALGQMRDERAIEALTAALKDQNAEVRRHAAFALGQISRN